MKDERITIIPLTMQPDDEFGAEAYSCRTVDENRVGSVGKPIVIMPLRDNECVVGCDIRDGDTYYFTECDNRLIVANVRKTDGTLKRVDHELCQLYSPIRQISSTGDFIVISTDDGLLYAYFNGKEYGYIGEAPQFPVMAFGTTDKTEIAMQIPSAKLKCQYADWRGTLQPDDASVMTRSVNSTVDKIRNASKSGFRSIQPLMLRTALRLWDDSLLWSPAAALAGDSFTVPSALASVTALAAESYRIENSQLKATAWKPSVTLIDSGIGNWKPFIKAVEIYASAEPDIFSGTVTFRCESGSQGESQLYLRITPDDCGAERAFRAIPTAGKFRLLLSITDIESLMSGKINASGAKPSADSAGGDLTDRTYAIDVADTRTDTEYTPYITGIAPKILTTIGNRCFAAGITSRLPDAPRLEPLCASAGLRAETATATVAVELLTKAGKSTVVKSAAYDCRSEKLNGLITYPDARAVKITVNVTAGGKQYAWSSKMQPNHRENFAYAVSDTGFFELKPTTATDLITASGATFSDTDMLLAAASGNPLQWEQCGKAHNKGICAIAASSGYGSSWLLGRHSAYMFATEGIYLLSFDKAGHCTGGSLISQRTAKSSSLTAETPEGIAFIDSNGTLCRLTGSKVKPTGITVENATALGFSPLYNETLILSADGMTVAEHNGRFYRKKADGLSLLNFNGSSLIVVGNNLYSPNGETAEKTEFELRTKAIGIPHGKVVHSVVWDISAADADIELTVYGENGRSCCGSVISRLKVTGNINSPLPHRLPPVRTRTIRLSVKGTGIVRIAPLVLRI